LSEIGKRATYTYPGQALDFVRRNLGMSPRESSNARAEYISTINNEIIPILRQSFGAAFTEKDREALVATLGDANAAPDEKNAIIRAFISSKENQISSLARQGHNVIEQVSY
jgi:hypothetical protein